MGSGASAPIQASIATTTEEDLSAALAGLGDDERAKLAAALGTDSDEARGGANAVFDVAYDNVDAPFLKEAFKTFAAATIEMTQKAMDEDADFEKLGQAMEAKFLVGRGLLEKSFAHHDKTGDGVLDKVEAANFFKNLMELSGGFIQHVMEFTMKASLDAMVAKFKEDLEMDDATKAKFVDAMKKEISEGVMQNRAKIAGQLEEYKLNKEERDAEAFKLIDTAGDGTLNKEEFLEAFFPGSDKNQEVMVALGFP